MIELTLLSYEGPGSIAGIPLEVVKVSEHAEGMGESVIRRWWEVSAEAAREDVPKQVVMRAAAEGSCLVEVPGKGEGLAEVLSVALDGHRWQIELRGSGRAPLA